MPQPTAAAVIVLHHGACMQVHACRCMHACNGKTVAAADNNNTGQTNQTNNNIGQGEKKQSTGAGLQAWRKGHCGAAIFWLLLIL